MFKKIIILLILLHILKGEEMKNRPKIDFYSDNKSGLMWLINMDMPKLLPYSKELALQKGYSDTGYSYETYLEEVNMNDKFKYSDWRLPTKDELLTLEEKGFFLKGWFMSNEEKEKSKAININIFYDHPRTLSVVGYWSNTECNKSSITKEKKKAYILVEFGAKYSYKGMSMGTHLKRSSFTVTPGVFEECEFVYTNNLQLIRLVRDIKE